MPIGTTPRKKSTPPEFLPVGLSLSNPRVVQEEYRDEVSKIRRYFGGFRYFRRRLGARVRELADGRTPK
jgi:hypothetical protein